MTELIEAMAAAMAAIALAYTILGWLRWSSTIRNAPRRPRGPGM